MNLSSDAFSDTINQFGSTFFGSLFEHCSSGPLWIRDDGMIRVAQPEGTKFYNFAWGNHVANRKQKSEAKRTTQERNRRHERYIANRDRDLSEKTSIHKSHVDNKKLASTEESAETTAQEMRIMNIIIFVKMKIVSDSLVVR